MWKRTRTWSILFPQRLPFLLPSCLRRAQSTGTSHGEAPEGSWPLPGLLSQAQPPETPVEQEAGVSFTFRAVSWGFINKNRQLGIPRQNFHLIILLSYSSHWTLQVDGFSPVTARAAGVKDQACLTSLLVGVSTHTYRRLACWRGWGRDHWPSWHRIHYHQHCCPRSRSDNGARGGPQSRRGHSTVWREWEKGSGAGSFPRTSVVSARSLGVPLRQGHP